MSGLGADAQLKVTTEELRAKSESVSKIVSQMKKEYDELNSRMMNTSSYWTGDGGNAHRSEFKKQKSDVEEMFSRINEHIVDLQKMAGVYETTESGVVSTIGDSLPSDVII